MSLLLPAGRDDIRDAVEGLKVSKLMKAWRGGASADMDAIIDTVASIAAFAEANSGTLQELDVNPLLVTAEGAVAVDALIRTT